MVKIFRKCVKAYRSYVLYIRCKRAIKRADRNAVLGRKCKKGGKDKKEKKGRKDKKDGKC